MTDPDLQAQIRQGRGKFLAMAGTYSLGVFNDSFFKQAVMMIAVGAGYTQFAGVVMYLMALPFVLFAAYAGWMADRFSKRHIVIATKGLELVAMSVAAVGVYTQNWPLILSMVFLMGWQSALFSPALNGSIPELYPASFVPAANARLKAATTAAILLGAGLAGFALGADSGNRAVGRAVVAGAIVAVSALGLLASFKVVKRPAADPAARLPWAGPYHTLRNLIRYHRDALLAKVIWADAFIWGVAALQLAIVNQMGKDQFKLGDIRTGLLVLAELAGVAIGGLIVVRAAASPRWYRVLAPMALALGIVALLVGLAPLVPPSQRFVVLVVLLGLAGVVGGVFMIPCESFIQVRPRRQEKGAVISAGNFAVFSAIVVMGLLHSWLAPRIPPTAFFSCVALVAIPAAVVLHWVLRREGPAEWQAAGQEGAA